MSINRYFKPVDGLPGASGSLAASIPSRAIANANREVARVLSETTENKRGEQAWRKQVFDQSNNEFALHGEDVLIKGAGAHFHVPHCHVHVPHCHVVLQLLVKLKE